LKRYRQTFEEIISKLSAIQALLRLRGDAPV